MERLSIDAPLIDTSGPATVPPTISAISLVVKIIAIVVHRTHAVPGDPNPGAGAAPLGLRSDRMERIRLVVVFGGQSAEHEVSCTTASHVLAAADPDRYDIEAIGITKQGEVVRAEAAMTALAEGAHALPPALDPTGTSTDLVSVVDSPSSDRVVVLPLLHGPLGEDGTIQGLLELANVPYVGSGVLDHLRRVPV